MELLQDTLERIKEEKPHRPIPQRLYAWTGGLKHRAKLDENFQLATFANTLEEVVIETVEKGDMTKDLAILVGKDQKWLSTEGFLEKVNSNLENKLSEIKL